MPYPTRWKNEGKNLGRKHPKLSKKRRVFARKKRRGKRAERKSARKKHKAARARSRLEELTFGTFFCRRSDSHTCFFFFFFPFFFVYLEKMSLFPSIFCTISAFSLYKEYVVRSFLPDGVFSTL